MKSTIRWIDAVKKQHGLTSDYQLAKRWEISRALVSKYRTGNEFLSEETAAKVAADMGVELAFVLACAAAERARMPSARAAWLQLAARLGIVAGVMFLAFQSTAPLFSDGFYLADAQPVYYVKLLFDVLPLLFIIGINLLAFSPQEKD